MNGETIYTMVDMSTATHNDATRDEILSLKENIGKLVAKHAESYLDNLISTALQAGVNFDEDSRDTQEALFSVASQRADLIKLITRIVNND